MALVYSIYTCFHSLLYSKSFLRQSTLLSSLLKSFLHQSTRLRLPSMFSLLLRRPISMANPSEVSTLWFIEKHLLDEDSPVATDRWRIQESSAMESSSDSSSDHHHRQLQLISLNPRSNLKSSISQRLDSRIWYQLHLNSIQRFLSLISVYQTRNQFEPEFKNQIPSASVDSQSNRKSPLKISVPTKTEWIQFNPQPEVAKPSQAIAEERKQHYRGVRQRPWGRFATRINADLAFVSGRLIPRLKRLELTTKQRLDFEDPRPFWIFR